MLHFDGAYCQLFLLIFLEIYAISALPLLHEIGNHSSQQLQNPQIIVASDMAKESPEVDGIQKEEFESTKMTLDGRWLLLPFPKWVFTMFRSQGQSESDVDMAKEAPRSHLTADASSVMHLGRVIGGQMKEVENFHEQLELQKHGHGFAPPIELPLASSPTTTTVITTSENAVEPTNYMQIGEEAMITTTTSNTMKEPSADESAKVDDTGDSERQHNDTMATQEIEHSKVEEKPNGIKQSEDKMEGMKEKKEKIVDAKHSVEDTKEPEAVEATGHDAKSDKKEDEKPAVIAIKLSKGNHHAEDVGRQLDSEGDKKGASSGTSVVQMAPPQVDEYLTAEELEDDATEEELSILQKILLGFRCSSQDCGGKSKFWRD